MTDDLVKRHIEQLRLTGGDLADLCQPLADAIEYLIAEREAFEQDNHRWKMECENFWRDRERILTAERDRLWEALMDAREAWDNHMEYGEPMQGWWVADARAALKGETP